MKSYARLAALFLCVFILLTGLFNASADAVDKEAPVIHGLTIENHTAQKVYTPNDSLKITVDATDNIQISTLCIYITHIPTGENSHYELSASAAPGKYTREFSLSNFVSGDYHISSIWARDGAGNDAYKQFSTSETYYCFSISNPSYDPKAPHVVSFTVTPDKGDSKKTKFTYKAVIEPRGSTTIERVQISAGNRNVLATSIYLKPTGKKNEYAATVVINDCIPAPIKRIEVLDICVATNDGNTYFYHPKGPNAIQSPFFHILENITAEDLTIEMTNMVEDTEPPTLDSYKYSNTELYTPDYLNVLITATDKTTEPNSATIILKKEDNPDYSNLYSALNVPAEGNTKTLKIQIDFPKYCGNGTYYISEIKIADIQGNQRTYSLEQGTLQKQTFEVKDTVEADYYTSVTATDLLDVVRQAAAEKGKTVLININENNAVIPKAVFEIISGKDVTVIFEKMYDNKWSNSEADDGFEWVMYGKHVDKAKAKDINAYVVIKQAGWNDTAIKGKFKKPEREKGDIFIMINFADNGELPGKSTIRFKPGFTLRNFTNTTDMRLYYLNEGSNTVDFVGGNIKPEKNGYFHFNITHNSAYAFTGDYPGASNRPANGNNNSSQASTATSTTVTTNEDGATTNTPIDSQTNSEKSNLALTIILIVAGTSVLISCTLFGIRYYKKRTTSVSVDDES